MIGKKIVEVVIRVSGTHRAPLICPELYSQPSTQIKF